MHKKYLYIIIGLVGLGVGGFLFAHGHSASLVSAPAATDTIGSTSSQSDSAAVHVVPPATTQTVGASSYTIPVLDQESVLDAMRAFASSTSFAFTGRDYPSLGFFVDSINGRVSASGFNWMLYVNGKQSPKGASQETVVPGDVVQWRYEKGY